MSRKIFAGLDNFKKIINSNGLYVDKSELISELLNFGDEVVAIARPRRFGKSLNMSMLSYFFDIKNSEENRKLFRGLKIEKSPCFAEQGKYPVISLNLKGVKENSWRECVDRIKSLVADEYSKHYYLMESQEGERVLEKRDVDYFKMIIEEKGDEVKLKESLKKLGQFIYRYYGREIVILVDEYDTPIIEGELKGYFDEASNFMQGFLGDAFKGIENLRKGVITGITRLQGAGIFSGFNNADVCTIFNPDYKDKFGFTEVEIKELLKEYGIEDKEDSLREYYNGYNFRGEVIYNPYSVVKYIKKGEFGNFWLGSNSNDLSRKKIMQLMEMKGDEVIRKMVEDLLQGGKVRIKIREALKISEDMLAMDILNLLLHAGYLKYENIEGDGGYVEVSIPNLEIKSIYDQSIEEWIQKKHTMEEIEELKAFLRSVCVGDAMEVKGHLERYLNRRSIFDVEKVWEMGYHNFLFGLLQGLEGNYFLDSNKESGEGRFDIMLTPIKDKIKGGQGNKGVVIELKVGERDKLANISRDALKQIEEKKYYKNLEGQGIKEVRLVGIAFHKKEVAVALKEISFK